MSNTTASATFPLGVCNVTEQCTAIDPSMACSNHTCICLSSKSAAGGGLCKSTAGKLFPLSLGEACSSDTNCSSSALCLAGQCSCPHGFRPWDEQNCTAIYAAAPAHSWTSLLVVLSGSVLAVLIVLAICVLVHRNFDARWAKNYGSKKEPGTLIVSSQASGSDDTASTHVVQSQPSQTTDSMLGQQLDTDLPGGDVWQRDSLPVAGERSTELSNQLTTISELRGLCSAPDESFMRPVLSGEELYRKYPHLCDILPSSSEASSDGHQTASSTTPGRSELLSSSLITVKSREMSELPSALSSSSRRRRRARSIGAARRHVVFHAEPATSSGPAAAAESGSEQFGATAACAQAFGTSSTAWSSFGSSLDYMLMEPPVVASVRTFTSSSDSARPAATGRRRRHAAQTTSRDDAAKPSATAKPSK